MKQVKIFSFTLIEILVCMMLLAMAGSVAIYKGGKLLQERRFSTSSEKIISEILLTKSIALTYGLDINLVLEQKNGKIYLTRKTDSPPHLLIALFQKPTSFSELVFGKENEEKVITFYGNGWIEGEDRLTFSMTSNLKKQTNVDVKHSSRKAL
jgi:Tfp pilus assembly protein FimT